MKQRVAVITGASSGIGKETAKALVALGWQVIGQGRDKGRSEAAGTEIAQAAKSGGSFTMLRANLSLMAETKRLADDIKAQAPQIDLLFNNAGGVRDARYLTSEGTEETFAANHLAPFLLTRELLPLLKVAAATAKPGDVRVIATSSKAYMTASGGMHWDDIQHLSGDFPATLVYCEAKLANTLFTHELAKRLAPDGIACHALIPGPVYTNFASHGDANMQSYMKVAEGLTPAQVAETVVWMATDAECGYPGGRHFYEMQQLEVAPHGNDDAAAAQLWAESEALLAGLGY